MFVKMYCLKWRLSFQMLLNLHKKSWMDGLMLQEYNEHSVINEKTVTEMLELAKAYNKVIYPAFSY